MDPTPQSLSGISSIPTLGAGWHFPVARKGKLAGHEDGEAGIAMAADDLSVCQSIEIIISTNKGERAMRPEFGCGLDKLLFAPNNGATRALAAFEVKDALKKWEPRIEVLNIDATAGGDKGEVILIDIRYRVRSTDNRFSLVYPFYLDRAVA